MNRRLIFSLAAAAVAATVGVVIASRPPPPVTIEAFCSAIDDRVYGTVFWRGSGIRTIYIDAVNVDSGSADRIEDETANGVYAFNMSGAGLIFTDARFRVDAAVIGVGEAEVEITCTDTGAPRFQPYVESLSSDIAAPYFTVPYNGQFACGVFDTGGHGLKIAPMPSFPNCAAFAPNLTVACMSGEGQWVTSEIFDLVVTAHEINFASGQHGTCAIFPVVTETPTPVPTEEH